MLGGGRVGGVSGGARGLLGGGVSSCRLDKSGRLLRGGGVSGLGGGSLGGGSLGRGSPGSGRSRVGLFSASSG